MKTVPYWTDRTPRPDGVTVEEPPSTADVVIIGAGVTGLTAARRLADLGRTVVVVDAMEIGQGASAINGGQLNYGLKPSTATLTKRFGPEVTRTLWDASLDAIDLAERIIAEDGFDAGFRRSGAVSLGYRKDGVEGAQAESRAMRDTFGFETTVVEGDELSSVIGSDAFAYGVISTVDAAVDPAKYTFGLAGGVARRGVPIVEHCRVTGLYRSGSTYFVATVKGTIQAAYVLLATNGYTPKDLVPEVRRQVVPIGSYMVATVPLAPENAKPCVLAFQGDVYKGLNAATLSESDLEWAQSRLRILSGLYGVLRPLDLIQPYRLEMGTRLDNPRGPDLYAFWGDRLAEALNAEHEKRPVEAVLNLASQEYFKAVPVDRLRPSLVTAEFRELRDGEPKMISFYAKRARGLLARFVIDERVESPEGLKEFDEEGYSFRPELSGPDRLLFMRDQNWKTD